MAPTHTERISELERILQKVQADTEEALDKFRDAQAEFSIKASVIDSKVDRLEAGMEAVRDILEDMRRGHASEVAMEQGAVGDSGWETAALTSHNDGVNIGAGVSVEPGEIGGKSTYSISERIKVWQRTMGLNKVARKGDCNFPAAKQDYLRLHKMFELPPEMEREMVMLSFEKTALKVANQVVRENDSASMEMLWEALESRLYNDSQKRAQNTAYLLLRWNEKRDTLQYFSDQVLTQGQALNLDEELIRATFIGGLPSKLQSHAYGIIGTYDDMVAAVANIHRSMGKLQRSSESVSEVREVSAEVANEVLRAKDVSSSVQNPSSSTSNDWKKGRRCYVCGELGHIARETDKCSGKRKDDSRDDPKFSPKQGKEKGSTST